MSSTQQFFEEIFRNAKANGILIMDEHGIITEVNQAFTAAYGYTMDDLKGQHFRIFYMEKDQRTRRPEIELNTTHREGAANDENYLVHKDGTPIWVTGESVLVKTSETTSVVKIIHNIHAQKQLERYLLNTSELLDGLFESARSGLIIINSTLKVVRVNDPFMRLFHLTDPVLSGCRLQQIPHPFFSEEELKSDLVHLIVNATVLDKEYLIDKGDKSFSKLQITSKAIVGDDGGDKQILLVIRES
jgi:PAS domain S-box-containing protein